MEQEAHLGYLVGNVPSSVRFVSFRGCISSDSVQVLCILLKSQNAAFIQSSNYVEDNSANLDGNFRSKISAFAEARYRPAKGILGLAISHSTMVSGFPF